MSRAAADAAHAERRQKQNALRVQIAQRDVAASVLIAAFARLASSLEYLRNLDRTLDPLAVELGIEPTPAYERVRDRLIDVIAEAVR